MKVRLCEYSTPMCELGFYSYDRSFTRYEHVHMRLIVTVNFHSTISILAPELWYVIYKFSEHGRL